MIKREILDKIKSYDRIMLFRHVRIDGDCVGAAKGLQEILRLTYPEKEILLIDDERSDYLAFICGEEDAPVPDEAYCEALGIVLDTATTARIASLKYRLCKEIIKIDHHLESNDDQHYSDLSWVEPHRSSACEMVVEFYDTFRDELKINARAATLLYLGMVTDSGRFQFDCVTGDTLRYAAKMLDIMLDAGVDTQWLYANLYLRDKKELPFRSYVFEHIDFTENGVASIYIGTDTQKAFDLTHEAASNALNEMDCFKNCICWIAFVENGDEKNSIRVRIRSRFANINPLAAARGGGGHIHASAATVYSKEEVKRLLDEADALMKEYKETHDGWL